MLTAEKLRFTPRVLIAAMLDIAPRSIPCSNNCIGAENFMLIAKMIYCNVS